jgi:hypothetical protein
MVKCSLCRDTGEAVLCRCLVCGYEVHLPEPLPERLDCGHDRYETGPVFDCPCQWAESCEP